MGVKGVSIETSFLLEYSGIVYLQEVALHIVIHTYIIAYTKSWLLSSLMYEASLLRLIVLRSFVQCARTSVVMNVYYASMDFLDLELSPH